MQNKDRDNKAFTRRTFILSSVQASLGAIVLCRLYYLQMIEGKKYFSLSEENRLSLRLLVPKRGIIVDHFGTPLASNKKKFRLVFIPENIKNITASLENLKKIISEPDISWEDISKKAKRSLSFYPIVIKKNLSWEEVSLIELSLYKMPGVFVEEHWVRNYNFPASMSHILGYVSKPSQISLKKKNAAYLNHPDIRVGKSGIEKIYNSDIKGKPGSRTVEVNARGRLIREVRSSPAVAGAKLQTTLDVALQEKIQKLLEPYKSGAAVVLDIKTGATRALVSTPSFDSNIFTSGIHSVAWRNLTKNEYRPLVNKAIQGQYAPASTFKIVSALAALKHGIVTPNTTFNCPGYIKIGNRKFHCWKKHGHGVVNLNKALKQSCDVYFYEIGKKLDIDKLAEVSRSLGLGQKTGIDLPGEQSALVPTKQWKKRVKKQPWYFGETIISAIGQGYTLTTPLQLAVMMARLISKKKISPYIVAPSLVDFPVISDIDDRASSMIQKALSDAVNTPEGTSWRHRLPWNDWKMAGKTGTAQVRRITLEERNMGVFKNTSLPWKYRDHALFLGFAPVHDPQFAVSVIVEHTGFGSTYAAPIAKEIMKYLKNNGSY